QCVELDASDVDGWLPKRWGDDAAEPHRVEFRVDCHFAGRAWKVLIPGHPDASEARGGPAFGGARKRVISRSSGRFAAIRMIALLHALRSGSLRHPVEP